jgi:hypothetical protein
MRVLKSAAIAFVALAGIATDVRSQTPATINLVCDGTTRAGRAIKVFVFIDVNAKYVKVQEPNMTMDYTDGAFGKIETQGLAWFIEHQAPGKQHVASATMSLHLEYDRAWVIRK